MIGAMVIIIFLSTCGAIYWGIREGARFKFENEEEKEDFLENKFKGQIDTKIDGWTIKDVYIQAPFKKDGKWLVKRDKEWGVFPFDQSATDTILTVTDEELTEMMNKEQ